MYFMLIYPSIFNTFKMACSKLFNSIFHKLSNVLLMIQEA